MSFWLYHLISGDAFFTGIGLMMAGVLLTGRARRTGRTFIGGLLALSGLILVILSSTPASTWLCSLELAVLLFWVGSVARTSTSVGTRQLASLSFLATVLLAVVLELSHRRPPKLAPERFQKVYVIGDSISAGITRNIRPWPLLLQDRCGLTVANLSTAGADLRSAREQADQIQETHALVVMEIGGNDLIQKRPASEFESDLNQLLAAVCRPGRMVVMLELPLLPVEHAYGAAQRRQSEQFGVRLVPKRNFAAVLCQRDATIDGLHLSAAGHQRMAEMIWGIVRSSLAAPSPAGHP